MSEKVSTGIIELDGLLDGGFPRGSLILVAGCPGAGKTILSAKFIYDGAVKYGEPGVYVCLAESKGSFIREMKDLGLNFEALTHKNIVSILDLSIGTEIEVQSAINQIMEAVTMMCAERLVIDSITALSVGLRGKLESRQLIRLLYKLVQKLNCTTLMVVDMPWGTERIGSGVEEFVADGIILMQSLYDDKGLLRRQLKVLKMRGSKHALRTYEYSIEKDGIVILKPFTS